jgi:hypothetical protein
MAQDAQDDGGSYGRWWRCWVVAQDGVVAAAQDGATMAQRSTVAVARAVAQDDAVAAALGSGTRWRGGSKR